MGGHGPTDNWMLYRVKVCLELKYHYASSKATNILDANFVHLLAVRAFRNFVKKSIAVPKHQTIRIISARSESLPKKIIIRTKI